MTNQRFAIKQECSGDPEVRGPLFWAFVAWQGTYPDLLMTKEAAERELARLAEKLPHRASVLSIIDVPQAQERAHIYGSAFTAVFHAANWDQMSDQERVLRRPDMIVKGREAGNAALVAAGFEPN